VVQFINKNRDRELERKLKKTIKFMVYLSSQLFITVEISFNFIYSFIKFIQVMPH